MAAAPGELQEEALRRRERLKALRERTGASRKQTNDDEAPEVKLLKNHSEEEDAPKHKELKLRNYVPEDEELKERVVPKAKPASVEDKVKDQLEAAKPELIIEEVVRPSRIKPGNALWLKKGAKGLSPADPPWLSSPLGSGKSRPRKPDWDLKRDVAKKLEKLEKRTQRAIAELIRERLRGQEENLASAVDSAKQEGSDSD